MAIRIKKDEENPESTEVLAASIIRIAEGFEYLLSSPLNDRAIIALLMDMPGMTGIGKREVAFILKNLKTLKGYYLRK